MSQIYEGAPTEPPNKFPETARLVSDFILAVETATPDAPVAVFDALTNHDTVVDLFEEQLETAVAIDELHNEFFANLQEYATLNNHADYGELAALTTFTLEDLRATHDFRRRYFLGHRVMQLAEVAMRSVQDPSLVTLTSEGGGMPTVSQIAGQLSTLLADSFRPTYADRILGDATLLPLSRFGYAGFLADTLYRFWVAKLDIGRRSPLLELPPELEESIKKTICRFPTGILSCDGRALCGTPDFITVRKCYETQLDAYKASLDHNNIANGPADQGNALDAADLMKNAVQAVIRHGYSQQEAFEAAVENTQTIRKGSEYISTYNVHTDVRPYGYRLDLSMTFGPPKMAMPFPGAAHMLNRRHEQGGGCPARYLVRLQRQGETHQKIQTFADGMTEHIHAKPPVLYERKGEVYLDAAALMLDFTLFSMVKTAEAHNPPDDYWRWG